MTLLLDTVVLVKALIEPDTIPPATRSAIEEMPGQVFVSAISPYEIELKRAIGKIVLPDVPDWNLGIASAGLSVMPVNVEHAVVAARLPHYDRHKDPWDRLIIAQAISHGLIVVTNDRNFQLYDIDVLW